MYIYLYIYIPIYVPPSSPPGGAASRAGPLKRENSLLTTYWFIIEMIWWTGLAPWEFELPLTGSLISTVPVHLNTHTHLV